MEFCGMKRETDRKCLKHARVHANGQSFDRCETSGPVQHRKSATHGLPVTLRVLRLKSDKSDWFWSYFILFYFINFARFSGREAATIYCVYKAIQNRNIVGPGQRFHSGQMSAHA